MDSSICSNCQTFYLDVILCEGHLNGQEGQGVSTMSAFAFLMFSYAQLPCFMKIALLFARGCYRRIITIGGALISSGPLGVVALAVFKSEPLHKLRMHPASLAFQSSFAGCLGIREDRVYCNVNEVVTIRSIFRSLLQRIHLPE